MKHDKYMLMKMWTLSILVVLCPLLVMGDDKSRSTIVKTNTTTVTVTNTATVSTNANASITGEPRIRFPQIEDVFETYRRFGGPAAIDKMVQGAPRDVDGDVRTEVTPAFSELQSSFGSFTGYDVMRVMTISSDHHRLFLKLNYERGTGYAMIDQIAKANGVGYIAKALVNRDPERIFPQNVVERISPPPLDQTPGR